MREKWAVRSQFFLLLKSKEEEEPWQLIKISCADVGGCGRRTSRMQCLTRCVLKGWSKSVSSGDSRRQCCFLLYDLRTDKTGRSKNGKSISCQAAYKYIPCTRLAPSSLMTSVVEKRLDGGNLNEASCMSFSFFNLSIYSWTLAEVCQLFSESSSACRQQLWFL